MLKVGDLSILEVTTDSSVEKDWGWEWSWRWGKKENKVLMNM